MSKDQKNITADSTIETARPGSESIDEVDELNGWITTAKAADILGVKVASMSYIIYSKKVHGLRIAGVILIEKSSVEAYKKDMDARKLEADQKRAEKAKAERDANAKRELQKKLESLTPEQMAKLLAQVSNPE